MGAVARRQRVRRLPWATTLVVTGFICFFAISIIARGSTEGLRAPAANAALFVLLLWLSTVAHEAGHALAAKALGMPLMRVTVGYGPSVFTTRLFGAEWRFGSIPIGGKTAALLGDPGWARLRLWLMVAAGPLVTAVLLGGGMLFAEPDAARELAPARMLQASNTILLALALLPLPASDGVQLLFMWRMPKPQASELRAAEQHHACLTALNENRLEEAQVACANALAEAPDNIALLNTEAIVDIRAGRFERARENLRRLLERSDLPPPIRPVLLNNIAWTAVMLDDRGLLQEADEISREAVRKHPNASAYGTRGAVLVLRGQPRRGIVHLRRAYERHEDDFGSASAAAWLGVAEAAVGDFAAAQEWLATAESLDPTCPCLPRARQLVDLRRARSGAKKRRAVELSEKG